jgi:inosine-uridine nucleoside N-ribohydrolase
VTTPIVIDCDPGHDDAIAILLALASPELELVGVTTVAGNQTLDKTTRNALVTLEIGGRTDIPVAVGAEAPLRRNLRTAAHVHGETGLDGPELPEPSARPVEAHAADFLAELIEQWAGSVGGEAADARPEDPAPSARTGVVLVPTAPLTNLALMLERHPDVPDRLERIVWMGGAIAEGNITPAAEFNAYVDPEAAATVFASGIPITMVGLDVTHKALFTRAHAERLREAGRAGRFVAELSDFFQVFHERSYGFDGSPIHDAMAVAHVIDPTLLTTRPANVAVETRSDYCDGRTVVDLRGVTGREPNADVGVEVDAERFLELLVSRIASLP